MTKKRNIKILLTGGHAATTAISLIEEIIRRSGKKHAYKIYWVGTKTAIEGKNIQTLESKIIPKLGVEAFYIRSGKLQMKLNRWSVISFLRIPLGFVQSIKLLFKIKPQIVVSFGGHSAFPIVFCAWFLGIPIIIHEQTCQAGRANQMSAFFAKKIALSRPSSIKYFPEKKCIITGNPVLTQIGEVSFKDKPAKPSVIFFTLGSRGSQIINKVLIESLNSLLKSHRVIHITGDLDYQKFLEISKNMPFNIRGNYEFYPSVDPMKLDNLYRESDIVVARAGANTVSEIITVKRPSVLIPIPWTYMNEQGENAQYAANWGVARILPQDTLNKESLINIIKQTLDNYSDMAKPLKNKVSPDALASIKLMDLVEIQIK